VLLRWSVRASSVLLLPRGLHTWFTSYVTLRALYICPCIFAYTSNVVTWCNIMWCDAIRFNIRIFCWFHQTLLRITQSCDRKDNTYRCHHLRYIWHWLQFIARRNQGTTSWMSQWREPQTSRDPCLLPVVEYTPDRNKNRPHSTRGGYWGMICATWIAVVVANGMHYISISVILYYPSK